MNQTPFDLSQVLRVRGEWQLEGLIMEDMDFVYRKGLVNWRWNENLFKYALKHPFKNSSGATIPNVYSCYDPSLSINVYVDLSTTPPTANLYDVSTGKKGSLLEVFSWISHWIPNEPQWFINCIDNISMKVAYVYQPKCIFQ